MHTPLLTRAAVVRTCAPENEKKMSFDNCNTSLRAQVLVLVTLTTMHDWAGIDPQV